MSYQIEQANFYINIFSFVGILVAAYSYYVKVKYLKNPGTYRALCDINEHMSCSRVVSSE